jgi:hypothetical protein
MKNFSHSFVVSKGLTDTFGLVFDDRATLDAVHGEGRWSATPWADGKRNIRFEMEPGNIPAPVLKIIGNGKMVADVRQTLSASPDEVVVKNRVRPKVVGAEFVRVRPTFTLTKLGLAATRVAVSCDVCAIIPPPFNGMVEDFMRRTAEVSFAWLQSAISSKRDYVC